MKKVILFAFMLACGTAFAQSNKLKTATMPTKAEKVETSKALAEAASEDDLEENADEKPTKTPQERGKAQAERFKKKLGLNDTQYERVLVMTTSRAEQIDAIREKYGKDRKGMFKEVNEVNTKFNATLKQVLDEKQWTKYEEILAKRKEKMRERMNK
jgi:predicted transglutaminase-like cysteine proteinase